MENHENEKWKIVAEIDQLNIFYTNFLGYKDEMRISNYSEMVIDSDKSVMATWYAYSIPSVYFEPANHTICIIRAHNQLSVCLRFWSIDIDTTKMLSPLHLFHSLFLFVSFPRSSNRNPYFIKHPLISVSFSFHYRLRTFKWCWIYSTSHVLANIFVHPSSSLRGSMSPVHFTSFNTWIFF